MTDANPETRAGELDTTLANQLDWSSAALGLVRSERGGKIRIEAALQPLATGSPAGGPAATRASVPGAVVADPLPAEVEALVTELAAENETVVQWLREARQVQQRSASGAWEAEPEGDPTTIHEIATPLLSPYSVRHGHTRLAGCTLEPCPLLRLSWLAEDWSRAGALLPAVARQYYGTDGRPCDSHAGRDISEERLHRIAARLGGDERSAVDQWVAASVENDARRDRGELLDVTVVWCRWASGKIVVQFESGPSALIPFAGRAREYAAGTLLPPRFRCSHSGLESYEIIALDDGTVTVPAAVGRCELTGRERLHQSLAVCEASGMRVDREQLAECEASGRLALADRLIPCQWCDRRVLPDQIRLGRCADCREPRPLRGDDPRLAVLRAQHPEELARLGGGGGTRWSGWIGARVGIVVAGGVWQHRLLVFDPQSGRPLRRGNRPRLSRRWTMEDLAGSGRP